MTQSPIVHSTMPFMMTPDYTNTKARQSELLSTCDANRARTPLLLLQSISYVPTVYNPTPKGRSGF